jgi:hypothetical protein
MGSLEAVRRKRRALTAVAGDAGATEHERATAEALKTDNLVNIGHAMAKQAAS